MSNTAVIPFPVQAPGVKASQALPLLATFNLGQAVWSPPGTESYINEGYAKNWVMFTAVNDIATSAANIPLNVYKRSDDSLIVDHPVTRLLRRPSPFSTDVDFFTAVYAYFKIAGNAYLEWSCLSETGEGTQPEELYVLPPLNMSVVAGKLYVAGYEFQYNGQIKRYLYDIINHKSRICHWKTFNPKDHWYGMSACEAAAMAIDTHNQASTWNKSLLDNGARPSGALVFNPKGDDVDNTLTDDQYAKLSTRMAENWSGSKNTGRPILLEGGLEWQQMSLSPNDLDFLKGKNTDAIGIANALDYPPFLLGLDTGQATFSNVKEARASLYEDGICPMVTSLCKKMTNWLAPYFGDDWYIGYDEDDIAALQPKRDLLWKRLETATWITVNEKRQETRHKPIKGGDVVLISGISVPLGDAGQDSVDDSDEKSLELEAKNDNWESYMYEMGYGISEKDRDSVELLKQQRLQDKLIKAATPKINAQLQKEAKAMGAGYVSSGRTGASAAIKKSTKQMTEILATVYKRTMPIAGTRLLDSFKSSNLFGMEVKADTQTLFEMNVSKWIGTRSLEQAKALEKTTEEKMRKILLDSVSEGEGSRAIGKKITDAFGGEFSRNRADKIARTEVHQSFNVASQQAAEASELKIEKKWLSAQDERTRESHQAVNGDIVGLNKKFTVGGSKLLYPGDPNGAAGEVINCRCAVRHIPVGI